MDGTAVLVHGGFHGGWCWQPVAERLRRSGWRVYAPSLTGLADRAHLLGPEVTLETHVEDIVGLIECEELNEVTLCAHSAGGVVAAVVADRLAERLRRLVFLDATVPADGESLMDVLTEAEGLPKMYHDLATEQGDGWKIPPTVFSAQDFGIEDAAAAGWVERRLSAHPYRPFVDAAVLGRGGLETVGEKEYVRCEGFPITFGNAMIERYEADSTWTTQRWPIGHDAMVIDPDRVAALVAG